MLVATPSQHFADRDSQPPPPAPDPGDARPLDNPRQGYTLVGALLAVMIGWGVSGLGSGPLPGLLVRTQSGLTVLDAQGEPVLSAAGGQVSPDGSVVVHTETLATGTTLVVASDAATGATRWSTEVVGRYAVRLVAEGGAAAVLGPTLTQGASPYVPEGRSQTRLMVVSPSGAQPYHLEGNFEPEAMSLDESNIFVIQYTPPLVPESYQVRRLDLTTGEVGDVFTPDEELQQEMGGTARTQVASADGRRLYTLYTLAAADGSDTHAFIHVLDLDEQWAHCIDLPAAFTGAGDATALALSPDGGRLYAADRAGGVVAAIDTKALEAVAVETLPRGTVGHQAVATAGPGDDLYVSAGKRVDVLDGTTLQPLASHAMPRRVKALHVHGKQQLAVGLLDRIVLLDPVSGTVAGTHSWDEGEPIIGLGTAPGRVPEPREGIDCAC